jgi:hypothetical protein
MAFEPRADAIDQGAIAERDENGVERFCRELDADRAGALGDRAEQAVLYENAVVVGSMTRAASAIRSTEIEESTRGN